MKPTREDIIKVLDYESESGIFRWKYRDHGYAPWNGAFVGKVAGAIRPDGYSRLRVNGVLYMSHILAWVIVTGSWPKEEIDHRNCVRSDCRFENLREATSRDNKNNRKGRSKLGMPKGVSTNHKRFKAEISISLGRKVNLGTFDTPEQAHSAYCAAANKYHGEFARTN